MKKTITILLTILLSILSFKNVKAKDELFLTINDQAITIDLVDPVNYDVNNPTFLNIENKLTVYTPLWHFNTTKTDNSFIEYIVVKTNGEYQVSNLNIKGDSYIPLDGFVISIPKDVDINININDIVLTNIIDLNVIFAIENSEGVRTVITNFNNNRQTGVNYYDREFNNKIKQTLFSSEIVVDFNIEKNSFYIKSLHSGQLSYDLNIPEFGFILSSYGLNFNNYFKNNNMKYNIGDEIMIIDNPDYLSKSEIEINYHGINVIRQTNFLVIYNNNYNDIAAEGFPNTNAYGYEAAVSSEGIIVDIGIHTKIPENGFVLSGNEKSEQLLRDNAKIGSIVEVDNINRTIKIINYDNEIKHATVLKEYNDVKNIYNDAILNLYDVNFIDAEANILIVESIIDEIKILNEQVKMHETLLIRFKSHLALNKLLEAKYQLMESFVLENRGIWHRPVETNLEDIIELLNKLNYLNINALYLETVFDAYSIYPSKHFDLLPALRNGNYGEYGNDYLKAIISEAHKRGIEVHAWTHILRTRSYNKEVINNPDWLIESLEGETDVTYYGAFLDPSNPKVVKYLVEVVDEMLTNYSFDGFQFDYIRYPNSFESPNNKNYISGFTNYSMTKFKEINNLEGDVRELINNNDISNKWDKFKQDAVTNVVKAITMKVREFDNVKISADISPDPSFALQNYMQDWTVWIKNGWLDLIFPMIYMGDTEAVLSYSKNIINIIDNLAYQYTGIAPVYYGFPIMTNQQQLVGLQQFLLGSAMFETPNLINNKEFENIIKISTNRKKALTPHSNPKQIIDYQLDDILDKIERIYFPKGLITNDNKIIIKNEIDKIKAMDTNNALEIYLVKDAVETFNAYIKIYSEDPAAERISKYLKRLIKALDIHISRELINLGYWNPEEENLRPNPNDFEYPIIDETTKEPTNSMFRYILITATSITLIFGAVFVIMKFKNKNN